MVTTYETRPATERTSWSKWLGDQETASIGKHTGNTQVDTVRESFWSIRELAQTVYRDAKRRFRDHFSHQRFQCKVYDPGFLSACKDLSEYKNSGYCILHFPGWIRLDPGNEEEFKKSVAEKEVEFKKVIASKLDRHEYNFRGAIFPESTSNFARFEPPYTIVGKVDFSGARFLGDANFSDARFGGTKGHYPWEDPPSTVELDPTYTDVDFSYATFLGDADFSRASFISKKVDFSGARFGHGTETSFNEASFHSSESTDFSNVKFDGKVTDFTWAYFLGRTVFRSARFSGERTRFTKTHFVSEEDYGDPPDFLGRIPFLGRPFGSAEPDFDNVNFGSMVTDFDGALFTTWVNFTGARFENALNLVGAEFRRGVSFSSLQKGVYFGHDVDFFSTIFAGNVYFDNATFDKSVRLRGKVAEVAEPRPQYGTELPEPQFTLNGIRIGQPDASLFQSLSLRPSWLVNVIDVRKLRLINVSWKKFRLKEELDVLAKTDAPHEMLARTCQELAVNAEENRDYPLANDFYYLSMETLRSAGWRRLGLIRFTYWVLSGYGVKPWHALGTLGVIWVLFAALYVLVPASEFYAFSPSNSGSVINEMQQATVYSLGAMARLNPEPKPGPGWFQFLVTMEGLLGPLQIGLLVLAIRRKVMR